MQDSKEFEIADDRRTGTAVSGAALMFLKEHDLGVLSTIGRDGKVSGAVVYYMVDEDDHVFVLTKAETQKAHDIFAHHQAALTVFEASTAQTVQMQGIAEVEPDPAVKARVFAEIVRPRPYSGEVHLPPVTTLHDGAFMVIRITPTAAQFADYRERAEDNLSARDLR